MFRTMLICLIAALPLSAWSSGGHYPVDDARLADPAEAGIEFWFSRLDGSNHEAALSPYWRPGGLPLELVGGLIRFREDGERIHRFEPAAKWQFVPIRAGRPGLAVNFQAGLEDGDWTDLLVNFPVSHAVSGGAITIHGNLGWIHDRSGEARSDRLFLGGGMEWSLAESLGLIAQVYREGADEEIESAFGLRFQRDGLIEIVDIALGRPMSGPDKDWSLTLGLGLAF